MRKISLQLIGGLVMLAAGGFWFLSSISVTTSYFGLLLGTTRVNGGLILVPFIAGLVWLFLKPKSVGAKLLIGLGLVVIVASILSSVRFVLRSMNLFEFLIILILLIGGSVLTLRALQDKKRN